MNPIANTASTDRSPKHQNQPMRTRKKPPTYNPIPSLDSACTSANRPNRFSLKARPQKPMPSSSIPCRIITYNQVMPVSKSQGVLINEKTQSDFTLNTLPNHYPAIAYDTILSSDQGNKLAPTGRYFPFCGNSPKSSLATTMFSRRVHAVSHGTPNSPKSSLVPRPQNRQHRFTQFPNPGRL